MVHHFCPLLSRCDFALRAAERLCVLTVISTECLCVHSVLRGKDKVPSTTMGTMDDADFFGEFQKRVASKRDDQRTIPMPHDILCAFTLPLSFMRDSAAMSLWPRCSSLLWLKRRCRALDIISIRMHTLCRCPRSGSTPRSLCISTLNELSPPTPSLMDTAMFRRDRS